MASRFALSVIIPVLNEARNLPLLLKQLKNQQGLRLQLIVADGGSTDGSELMARQGGAEVVSSPAGRARQMNSAARIAIHPTLLFLHADSTLEDPLLLQSALAAWQAAQASSARPVAGHFPLRFVRRRGVGSSLAWRYLEAKSASNRPQTINGDQGLLISRTFLEALGGFDEELPYMEDQAIAAAIFEQGQWMVLPGWLHTSARRFEAEGFRRRYLLMGVMMAFYWAGNRDFFRRARGVYHSQADARQLRLWPFFRALWQVLLKDLRPKQSLLLLYRFGAYGLQNLWQAFLFLDVLVARNRRPFLGFHDRCLRPLLQIRWLAALLALPAALLIGAVYLLLLAPLFFCLEAAAPDPAPLN